MRTVKSSVHLRVARAICAASVVMAMWGTQAYGQDQASPDYPAPAGSTQPAKPHFYSLGGGGVPLNGVKRKHPPAPPGCHLAKFGALPVEMVGLRASVPAKVNGRSTHFILDTGAFFSMMSSASAASLGVEPVAATKNLKLVGIGGDVKAQQAFVDDLHIAGLSADNAPFIIGGTDAGSALLGANLLDQDDLED